MDHAKKQYNENISTFIFCARLYAVSMLKAFMYVLYV